MESQGQSDKEVLTNYSRQHSTGVGVISYADIEHVNGRRVIVHVLRRRRNRGEGWGKQKGKGRGKGHRRRETHWVARKPHTYGSHTPL